MLSSSIVPPISSTTRRVIARPSPVPFWRPPLRHLFERLEDALLISGGNADSGILDIEAK